MKWRDANDYPEKSGIYITEVLIQESETYRPVAYNSFDRVLGKWYSVRACATDGIITKWLDESPSTETGQQGDELSLEDFYSQLATDNPDLISGEHPLDYHVDYEKLYHYLKSKFTLIKK